MSASYRKFNDRSCNSSTYHKKDGTAVRAKLNRETSKEISAADPPFNPLDTIDDSWWNDGSDPK